MGEMRQARRQFGGRFQIEQARQHAAVAAGIEHKARAQFISTVIGFDAQAGLSAAVVKRRHAVAEAHIHALGGGFVNQNFVKQRAAHLKRGAGPA